MCQIHIINKKSFLANTEEYQEHLESGAMINDHGSSALFIDSDGNHSIIRAMKFNTIMDMMFINDQWDHVVIHQRYTTQGEANLNNTHMWQVGDYFYCHNGVLRDSESTKFEVDSQLIGHHLEEGRPWDAIAYCQSEDYANTFIVNLVTKKLWVTRSITNTLFTDGNGQYSTRELVGEIEYHVPTNTVEQLNLDILEYDKWGYDDYPNSNYAATSQTYEEKVASATHGKVEEIPADNGDEVQEQLEEIITEFSRKDTTQVSMTIPSEGNINEIERDIDEGLAASVDDLIEIEQALHNAMASGDQSKTRKYNYLLERANGNG